MKALAKRTPDEIAVEIQRLKDERQAFQREHKGAPFREDVHAFIDNERAKARELLDRSDAKAVGFLGMPSVPSPQHPGMPNHRDRHAIFAMAENDAYWLACHADVDAARSGTFLTIAKADYDARIGRLNEAIAELEDELQRRREAAEEAMRYAGAAA